MFKKIGTDNFGEFLKMYIPYCRELAQYDTYLAQMTNEQRKADVIAAFNRGMLRGDFILNERGERIGFVLLETEIKYIHEEKRIYSKTLEIISEFYILPQFRRHGYGRKAFQTFSQKHTGEWYMFILKDNVIARQFWERAVSEIGSKLYTESDAPTIPVSVNFYSFKIPA